MNIDVCDDLSTTNKNKRSSCQYYQQIGAPTLIYEGSRRDGLTSCIASKDLPTEQNRELHETFRRRNRTKARWQYGLDVNHIKSSQGDRKYYEAISNKSGLLDSKVIDDGNASICSRELAHENDEKFQELFDTRWIDGKQQNNRLALLSEDDTQKEYVRNYAAHQHPYIEVVEESDRRKRKSRVLQRDEIQIDLTTYSTKQEFSINQSFDFDPSFLAPFDLESINEVTDKNGNKFGNKIQIEPPERIPQGNALLCIPSPYHPCSTCAYGYIILHPKGSFLERLCVSYVIPPIGRNNADDTKVGEDNSRQKKAELFWNDIASRPNEICLDDTILEIRQCGDWNVNNRQCIFIVRTGTHVSVVKLSFNRLDLEELRGCYTLEEMERLDLRTLPSKLPSFRPVALTSHPRYGNDFTPCKFAFVSHSVGSSASSGFNVVHSCVFGSQKIAMKKHDISNLKSISLIDFSNRHPMCLWSAASSYIRPALAPGAISKFQQLTKSPFGLGCSLFMIDLRSNSGSFQWSPSAEEMTTEGVHSINGILTDWSCDNAVFVTSNSAGKTYEIDGRMPCRAVNTWSLTSICEDSRNITLPSKSFYGEPSLLFKPSIHFDDDDYVRRYESPLMKVDTDFRANGIHLFQKPCQMPRFQTDSLECIGTAKIDATGTSSIAMSSYYDLTDVSKDTYICGAGGMRVPLKQFVDASDNIWADFLELDVLCTITMNNKGDISCHSLLECDEEKNISGDFRRFHGLPIGTSVINVPRKLDGRMRTLKNGHWNPTGGMNLNLFFSNTYPVPHNAVISGSSENKDCDIYKNANEVLLNPCKKKRIDESSNIVEIGRRTQKAALTIISEDSNVYHNEMIQQGEGDSLVMPLSLSQNVQRTTMVYEGKDDYDSDDDSRFSSVGRNVGDHRKSSNRTDLSKSTIVNILESWEE